MGKLGNELTEARSTAIALNIEDKIENLLFDAQINKKINNINDMKTSKKVKTLTFKQNEEVKSFNVTSPPSFYVSGKHKIENKNIPYKNIEDYVSNYANLISNLLINN